MRIIIFLTAAVGLVVLSGCGQGGRLKQQTCGMSEQRQVAGRSVQGRQIDVLTFGTGERTILFLASIHGSERAGTPLMEKFTEYLRENGQCRFLPDMRIVIIPVANPDGFAAKTRHNANNIDLNRNFPADNRENDKTKGLWAFSEPESRCIANLIDIYKPKSVITFHEALNCIDYDGPAQGYADSLAIYCDIPVKRIGSRPGSLGSYTGNTLGIPIITLEFPASVRQMDGGQLWDKYGSLVIAMCDKMP